MPDSGTNCVAFCSIRLRCMSKWAYFLPNIQALSTPCLCAIDASHYWIRGRTLQPIVPTVPLWWMLCRPPPQYHSHQQEHWWPCNNSHASTCWDHVVIPESVHVLGVMVRSLCLSVVRVLGFLTGVIPKEESEQAIQLGSWPNLVSMSVNQRGKVGVRSQELGLVM